MLFGQYAVTPCRDHKTLGLFFEGLLFLRISGNKVAALKKPCHLPGTPFQHAPDQPIASYDVGLSEGYP